MTTGGEALVRRIGRAAGPISRRITASRSLGVLALIFTGVLTLPVVFYPMPAGGEFTYQAAMIMALHQHLQWAAR